MSEKYILMGRGMPSIIPNDQTTPGTRLTATEARQYARRLVELADELTPADPSAPSGDDGRIAEIRGQLERITPGLEFYCAYMGEVIQANPPTPDIRQGIRDAEWHNAAPAAIRDLLARLDAVTKRAERRRVALEPFARLYEEALPTRWANHASDSVIYAFNDAELTLDDFKEAHRYARKESTDG